MADDGIERGVMVAGIKIMAAVKLSEDGKGMIRISFEKRKFEANPEKEWNVLTINNPLSAEYLIKLTCQPNKYKLISFCTRIIFDSSSNSGEFFTPQSFIATILSNQMNTSLVQSNL